MKPSKTLFFGTAIFATLVLAACKSLGSPEEQAQADDLLSLISGYESWGQFNDHPGIKPGASPHGKFVRTFINDVVAQDQANPGYGSIIVKENFGKEDESTLQGITVMQRIEGFDPENGDWFWARYSKGGEQTHSGKVAFCFDCHFDAGNDDFVFLND